MSVSSVRQALTLTQEFVSVAVTIACNAKTQVNVKNVTMDLSSIQQEDVLLAE